MQYLSCPENCACLVEVNCISKHDFDRFLKTKTKKANFC